MAKIKISEPNYYANIPADVRYCKKITANAKLLYGEITALCNKEGFCWASNKYFADLYNKRSETISVWVRSLKENGFIKYEIKDSYMRKIFLIGVCEKSNRGIRKIARGVCEKSKHNNTINNTKNNMSANADNKISSNWIKSILIWLEERRKKKFADIGQQIGALGRLKKAGYKPDEIKDSLLSMEKDDFWKDKSPDFINLAKHIHKIKKLSSLIWK